MSQITHTAFRVIDLSVRFAYLPHITCPIDTPSDPSVKPSTGLISDYRLSHLINMLSFFFFYDLMFSPKKFIPDNDSQGNFGAAPHPFCSYDQTLFQFGRGRHHYKHPFYLFLTLTSTHISFPTIYHSLAELWHTTFLYLASTLSHLIQDKTQQIPFKYPNYS